MDAEGRIIAASCMHGELNGISAFGKAMDAQPLLMNRQLECGVELRNWACKRAKNSSKTIQAHRVSPVRTLVPSACRCKKRRARAFVLRRWKEQPRTDDASEPGALRVPAPLPPLRLCPPPPPSVACRVFKIKVAWCWFVRPFVARSKGVSWKSSNECNIQTM